MCVCVYIQKGTKSLSPRSSLSLVFFWALAAVIIDLSCSCLKIKVLKVLDFIESQYADPETAHILRMEAEVSWSDYVNTNFYL